MFTLQDFIMRVCKELHIVCPKTLKKMNYPALAYYDKNKNVLIMQKDLDSYDLRYAVAVQLRYAYQAANKMNLDEHIGLVDANGFAYYFFDKYMDTAIQYDQFDEDTIKEIKQYANLFK